MYAGCVIHMLRFAVSPPFPELRGDGPPDAERLIATLVAFGTAGFTRLAEEEKGCHRGGPA